MSYFLEDIIYIRIDRSRRSKKENHNDTNVYSLSSLLPEEGKKQGKRSRGEEERES